MVLIVNTSNSAKLLQGGGVESLRSLMIVTFMLAVFISLFAIGAADKVQSDGGSNLFRQLTWLAIGAVAFFRCFSFGRYVKIDLQYSSGLLVALFLLGYCLLSFLWSAIPDVSLKRAILFSLMVFLCFAAFGKKSQNPLSFIQVMAWPLGLLLILSFAFTAAIPSVAITAIGWRGVTSFKNEFGQLCAISLLVFSFAVFEVQKYRKTMLLMAMLSLLGLLLSQSSTCAVAVIAGLMCSLGLLATRHLLRHRSGSALMLGLVIAACVAALVLLLAGVLGGADIREQFFQLLGKSSTLTGRTKLWSLILDNTRLHNPWLGGGYGGFWNGLGSPSSYTAYRFPAGYVGQAHNGYLDIFNDLGYVGLGLLVLVLLVYGWHIFRHYQSGRPEFYFHLAFFIYIILENYAESTFFRLVGFLNIVFFASLARVAVSEWVGLDDKKQA